MRPFNLVPPSSYNQPSMIAHLRGRLLSKTPNQAIVECAGVGYDVTISVATFSALPAEGAEAALYIHTHVREDQIALFGFSQTQKNASSKNSSPSPASAPSSPSRSSAASTPVASSLPSAPATTPPSPASPASAKKTAERVVLELKDKLDDLAVAIPTSAGGPHHGPAGDDALSALVNLGYARPIAQKAIETAITKGPGRRPRLRNPLPRCHGRHPLNRTNPASSGPQLECKMST